MTGCWIWRGKRTPTGYGKIYVHGRGWELVHRLAWERSRGRRVPFGMMVLHQCDVRDCYNPEHLCAGYHGQNMAERDWRGRTARGERNGGGGKLTAEAVREIRAAAAGGERQRDIARRFGISSALVSLIVSRRYWALLT